MVVNVSRELDWLPKISNEVITVRAVHHLRFHVGDEGGGASYIKALFGSIRVEQLWTNVHRILGPNPISMTHFEDICVIVSFNEHRKLRALHASVKTSRCAHQCDRGGSSDSLTPVHNNCSPRYRRIVSIEGFGGAVRTAIRAASQGRREIIAPLGLTG